MPWGASLIPAEPRSRAQTQEPELKIPAFNQIHLRALQSRCNSIFNANPKWLNYLSSKEEGTGQGSTRRECASGQHFHQAWQNWHQQKFIPWRGLGETPRTDQWGVTGHTEPILGFCKSPGLFSQKQTMDIIQQLIYPGQKQQSIKWYKHWGTQ